MKWEDLDKARAARAARDKAAVEKIKGKCGRKRKVSTGEVDGDTEGEIENEANAQEAGSSVPTLTVRKKAKRSRV